MNSPDLRGNPTGTASSAARDHAERAAMLVRAAELMRARRDELSGIVIRESG